MPQAAWIRSSPSTHTVAVFRSASCSFVCSFSCSFPRCSVFPGAGRYAWCPSSFSTSSGSSSQRSPSRARAKASGVSAPRSPTFAPPTRISGDSRLSRCQFEISTFPFASSGRSAVGTRSNSS